MDEQVGGWMGRLMDGWMDEWISGWMDGWMGGWMDEWVAGWHVGVLNFAEHYDPSKWRTLAECEARTTASPTAIPHVS